MVNSALNSEKLSNDECGDANWSRMNSAMIPEM
jgi:hypothetical protein